MKFSRPTFRHLATVAVGLLVLVACQNATDSNTNADSPVVVTAAFPIAAPRIPDNVISLIQKDTASTKLNCPPIGSDSSTTCTATLDLPHPLGADSVALQLWTLGVQTYTLYFKESGSSTTLDFGSKSVVSLDTLLLSKFAVLTTAQKASFGSGASGLVAYYASLILTNDTAFVGKSLPSGMTIDSVKKALVRVGVDSGKTVAQLTSLSIQLGSTTLTLDSTTIRLDVSVLIHAGVLSATDSTALFPPYPVRVTAPVAVSGPVVAGGSPANVTGSFGWTTGHNFKPQIRVRPANPADSASFTFPNKIFLPSDTTWDLSGNLTLQVGASASAGTDTLVVTLSDDAGHSATSAAVFTVTAASALAAPGFTPAGGTYTTGQSVSLTTSSKGAQIYYTTDGSTPTTTSTAYADTAISVPVGETIRAIAVEDGHPSSPVASATYVIGVAGSPAFSPAAGTYSTAQSVSLTSATPGATIYYTTDGSVPTTASTKYTGAAIPVVSSETIQAISVAAGMASSPAASAAYAIGSTSAPTFAPAAGTYSSVQNVVLSSATAGATIYYTTDGSTPTSASPKYNDTSVAVVGSETIKAIAIANGFTSATAVSVYTISIPGQTASPTFAPAAGTYSSAQNVTLGCTTSGATIYYTLDGSQPTTASSVYSAPISVTTSETIKALAVAAGSTNSLVASAAYALESPAAAPTFSPTGGSYTAAQSVTLASATPGAAIYYTLDGTVPTTSSSVYSAPLAVGASQTIKAIAVATNYGTSSVSSAVYAINVPGVTESPTFSPAGGTYTAAQSVTLASATSGATIYYTLDGSAPTTSSNVYGAPIAVATSETIRAIATSSGNSNSPVASAAYTIQLPAASPTFSPAAGPFTAAQTVTLASTTASATIYYTLDGTAPTTSSSVYSAPLSVGVNETIKAIAVATGYSTSAVASAAYTITIPGVAATPTFAPAPGAYTSSQSVTLASTTTGATIYYTTDGTAPTTSSSVYSTPLAVGTSETIKAIAMATGYTTSSVASAAYTITGTVATPTFSVAPGTYTAAQSVTLATTTTGASIYYTLDGTVPATTSTLYAGPISVATSETLKAIAVETGWTTSAVASAAYTITGTVAAPSFGLMAGTYTTAQSVTLATTTAGASIYYTTDGTAPTANSTAYKGAIPVTSTATIKAIATESGWANSAVDSATYTITGTVAAPTLSVLGGTYQAAQSVTLATTTTGASIYYTLDGTTPTATSTSYSAPVSVTKSETLKAIAVKSGWITSAVDSATYTITIAVPVPTISPNGGPFSSTQLVTISTTASGATLQDSLSTGSAWVPYNSTLTVGSNIRIFARAVLNGTKSSNAEADFAFPPSLTDNVANDTLPANGVSTSTVTVTAPGSDNIYVSADNLNWTPLKSGAAFPMTTSGTLKAYSVTGSATSATDSIVFSLYQRAPTMSPAGGIFATAKQVTLTSPSSGDTIYYTTDGKTMPSRTSTRYTTPFVVGASKTVKAIAVKAGVVSSIVTSDSFAIADTTTFGIPWQTGIAYGAVQDSRDGQVYRTVTIGSQTWMAQNLDYAASGSSCVLNGLTGADTCKKYGRLYTWSMALGLPVHDDSVYSLATLFGSSFEGVCPTGWRVPNESDWATLSATIDPNTLNLDVLRATNGWNAVRGVTTGNGSDKYGFRALPSDGGGLTTNWWTPTESDSLDAVAEGLSFNSDIGSGPAYKTVPYPVRCISP